MPSTNKVVHNVVPPKCLRVTADMAREENR